MAKETKEEKQTAAASEEEIKQDAPPEEAASEEAAGGTAKEAAQEEAAKEESPGKEAAEPEKKEKDQPDPRDEKLRELSDRLMRQMAEFENYRKRTDKEKTQMFEAGASSVIEKFLPVIDNFERALATVTEEQKADPFVAGTDKIYKQMLSVLEQLQVVPIEAVGQEFDPQLHNAVMHVEDDSYGENEVIEEYQKGYKYRDAVVRHSMVKVAN